MKRKRSRASRKAKSRTRKNLNPQEKSLDYILLGVVLILTFLGVVMVYNASVVEAYRDFMDKFYFAKQQLLWAGIGLSVMILLSKLPYSIYKRTAVWAFAATLLLLILVLLQPFGIKVLGARRWISLGGFTIQPAELAKLTMIMYLASYFSTKKRFLPFALIVALVSGLVMLEPDLGTTAVIASSAVAIYFYHGAEWKTFISSLIGIVTAAIVFILSSTYRKARVMTFLDPTKDPLGASYHIRQILIALGSGGLFGVGIGRSRQKYEYIPAATTDSIFAIIAEETGFFGAAALIALFTLLILRSFKIARSAPDKFTRLLAGGIATWIGIQIVINLGTMVALLPLTGVPLPLISYGGSATIVTLSGIGMLLSISRYAKEKP